MNCMKLKKDARWRSIALVAVAACMVTMTSASLSAAAITGAFGTTGAGVEAFSNLPGTIHYIDWCPTDPGSPASGSATCGTSAGGTGTLTAQGGSGTFTAVNGLGNAGTAGTIKDMSDAPSAPFTTFPVGVPVTINNWLTVAALPNLNFQANLFVPASCAPSATQLCIGGFVLTQIGQNVTVSMTVNGIVSDTSGVLAPAAFTDAISGQFNNTNIGAVATAASTAAGIFSNTWSGSVATSAVPEPATFGLIGAALLALGVMKFKRTAV
jgi:hypothetical protein